MVDPEQKWKMPPEVDQGDITLPDNLADDQDDITWDSMPLYQPKYLEEEERPSERDDNKQNDIREETEIICENKYAQGWEDDDSIPIVPPDGFLEFEPFDCHKVMHESIYACACSDSQHDKIFMNFPEWDPVVLTELFISGKLSFDLHHLYSGKQQKRKKEEKENLKSQSNEVTEVVSETKTPPAGDTVVEKVGNDGGEEIVEDHGGVDCGVHSVGGDDDGDGGGLGDDSGNEEEASGGEKPDTTEDSQAEAPSPKTTKCGNKRNESPTQFSTRISKLIQDKASTAGDDTPTTSPKKAKLNLAKQNSTDDETSPFKDLRRLGRNVPNDVLITMKSGEEEETEFGCTEL